MSNVEDVEAVAERTLTPVVIPKPKTVTAHIIKPTYKYNFPVIRYRLHEMIGVEQ